MCAIRRRLCRLRGDVGRGGRGGEIPDIAISTAGFFFGIPNAARETFGTPHQDTTLATMGVDRIFQYEGKGMVDMSVEIDVPGSGLGSARGEGARRRGSLSSKSRGSSCATSWRRRSRKPVWLARGAKRSRPSSGRVSVRCARCARRRRSPSRPLRNGWRACARLALQQASSVDELAVDYAGCSVRPSVGRLGHCHRYARLAVSVPPRPSALPTD